MSVFKVTGTDDKKVYILPVCDTEIVAHEDDPPKCPACGHHVSYYAIKEEKHESL